jgi:hypothetical protein
LCLLAVLGRNNPPFVDFVDRFSEPLQTLCPDPTMRRMSSL